MKKSVEFVVLPSGTDIGSSKWRDQFIPAHARLWSPQGRREGNLETFPAAAGGAAGCRGACMSRSSNSFCHIMCCVRETATEQKPRSLLSASSQNQCMQLGPMQKLPR